MNRIKDILKWQCITINELAEKMGLNMVTLSTQINGTANVASYEKIATVLNVPMWQLFASPDEVKGNEEDKNTITCPKCGSKFKMEE